MGHIIPKLNDNMNYGTLRSFFMVLNRFSGLSKEIYEERVTKLAQNCALFAKEQQVKLYVELSSAQVYGSSGKMSKVRWFSDDVVIEVQNFLISLLSIGNLTLF